jgi:hypothetical protein
MNKRSGENDHIWGGGGGGGWSKKKKFYFGEIFNMVNKKIKKGI